MTIDATNRFDSLDREERDALLSAYALGELEAAEREAVERWLADATAEEARRVVADSRAVAEALRAGRVHDRPPRSADLRRAVVAALADAGRTGSPPRPSQTGLAGWLAVVGALAATALVAVTVLRPATDGRDVARRRALERDGLARAEPGDARAARQPFPPLAAAPASEPAEHGDASVPHARVVADAEDKSKGTPSAALAESSLGEKAVESAPATAGSKRDALLAGATPGDALATAGTPATGAENTQAATAIAADGDVAAEGAAVAAAAQPATPDDPQDSATLALPVFGSQAGVGGRRRFGARPAATGPAVPADRLATELFGAVPAPRERYAQFEEHRFAAVAEQPLSTFSIDVDTASYAVARRFLAAGRLPPADAVRIEEFVNYFSYAYPQPAGDDPFAVAVEAADCPWRPGHRLVRIGIAGRDIDRTQRPAGNLVFLVDVSGSMDEPDKLPLVKQALALLVAELTENDRVSIVTYAGDAGLKLPPTSGDQKRRILDVIEGLSAGGSTHGSAGIVLAYEQAQQRFIPGGANRVILCTDGDLNVGVTSDAALVELVQERAREGTFLTVLGFGQGNLQDEKLEAIADQGNGVYAYVDGVREARKVLVEQLTGSTITIAKDVKLQVEFNPAQVASYRLIGYENRRLADADFRNDAKDAGDIGAGHTVTALYEIVPAGPAAAAGETPGAGAEPLKYQPQPDKPRAAEPLPPAGPAGRELLTVKLRFKQPEGAQSVLREYPLADHGGSFAKATADTRFAAAVAAFGMILRQSEFKGAATLPMVATIAGAALGPDAGGHRAEFLDLVRKAETIEGAAGEHRPNQER
jgi:secreted protein with Ig-like and vWFA domain